MLIFLIFFSIHAFSQNEIEKIKANEESINLKLSILLNSKSDSLKKEINKEIINLFKEILFTEISFEYLFDTLSNNISIIKSDDNLLRIFTWGTIYSDGVFCYYGFLQYKPKKKEQIKLYELIDLSDKIENPEKQTLTNENWYGALYYDVITKKSGKSKYYTLLGWDGNNDFSTKKIIEVLTFSGLENPKFGSSFKIDEKSFKRLIFEYNIQAQMLLQYNDDLEVIVFDHLSPSNPKFEGQYQYYGPDFSYDGLFFDNGVWNYLPDIDFKNIEK
jgi:hypothetical protein